MPMSSKTPVTTLKIEFLFVCDSSYTNLYLTNCITVICKRLPFNELCANNIMNVVFHMKLHV